MPGGRQQKCLSLYFPERFRPGREFESVNNVIGAEIEAGGGRGKMVTLVFIQGERSMDACKPVMRDDRHCRDESPR